MPRERNSSVSYSQRMDESPRSESTRPRSIYRSSGSRAPGRVLAGVALVGAALAIAALATVHAITGGPVPDPTFRNGPKVAAVDRASLDTGPPSSSPAVSGPDHRLIYQPHTIAVTTVPPAARVRLLKADAAVAWEGTSPATVEVPGGPLTLEATHDDCNPERRALVLDRDQEISLILDPVGLLHRSLTRFSTGSNPKQVTFSPDGSELWVSLLGGSGLEVFDASAGAKLAEVDLGEHGAVEVIFSADGSTVYASQMESASVFEIDRTQRRVLRRMSTGGEWTKVITLSPDERTLYAANWISNDVSEIDLTTGTVRRRLPTVRTPRGLYVTPDGRRLYVAGYEDGEIERIDLATGDSIVLLRTGGAMRHLVGDGRSLYADDMALDTVFVVDLVSEEVRELARTDEKPNSMDLSPDGRVLYVSSRGKNGESYYVPGPEWGSVLAIDTATGVVLDAIVGGNQCTGLDVSPDGRRLAFSDFLDNRVRLYAIPDYDTLAAGGGGRAVAHLADLLKGR